jgi:copper transport protein
VALLGTALMISAQAAENVGSYTDWSEVIHTQSGKWWLIRLILVAIAFVAVMLRGLLRRTTLWLVNAWLGGIVLLTVVAAGGHGITGRWVVLGIAATVAHLGAMAVWLGGLAAIVATVPRSRMLRMATAFSPMALGAVVVLAGTGTLNAWRQSGSWDDLVHSRYGTWLIVKLVIVVGVLALAMGSRWVTNRHGVEHADRILRRTIAAEVLGILVVMVATIGLVSSPPPHVAAESVASVTVVQGNRIAQVSLSPPVTGGTTMHVYLSDSTGALAAPTSITVQATLPEKSIGPIDIPVENAGPGHVIANDAVLPLPGTWTFAVTARYSEFDETVFNAPLAVR